MKIPVQKRLFWYLKEGAEMDLSSPSQRDAFVQQILARGKASDIKFMFFKIGLDDFVCSFERIKLFLPHLVRKFWEEWRGNTFPSPERNS